MGATATPQALTQKAVIRNPRVVYLSWATGDAFTERCRPKFCKSLRARAAEIGIPIVDIRNEATIARAGGEMNQRNLEELNGVTDFVAFVSDEYINSNQISDAVLDPPGEYASDLGYLLKRCARASVDEPPAINPVWAPVEEGDIGGLFGGDSPWRTAIPWHKLTDYTAKPGLARLSIEPEKDIVLSDELSQSTRWLCTHSATTCERCGVRAASAAPDTAGKSDSVWGRALSFFGMK